MSLRLLTLISLLLFAPQVLALSSPPQQDDVIHVDLISEKNSIASEQNLLLGLSVDLAEGWHTYWRIGGDAGMPPTLNWDGSENLKDAKLLFPAPHRATAYGMETIGYNGQVIFPIQVQLQDPEQPASLRLLLDILLCKDICVPKHFNLRLDIPKGDGAQGADAPVIQNAINKVPSLTQTDKLKVIEVRRSSDSVSVTIQSNVPFNNPDLFLENEQLIPFKKPIVDKGNMDNQLILTARLNSELPEGAVLADLPLTATITNGDDAIEVDLSSMTAPPSVQSTDLASTLFVFVIMALLGGLILNLMPCVLPVLSLKIFSVIKHSESEKSLIRKSFISTGAGIILSFLLLAMGLIILKQFGQAIGWGIQFQQPSFLIFMIGLLVLFAANLWGFFEIELPRFLIDRMDAHHHPKLAGDFTTGMLATLLATPCSAPFLGTAVGFALSAGSFQTLLIFMSLGIGMALPYLIIAFWPSLARIFPKPGNWMNVLRIVLGFGLCGTALWLLAVLTGQIGTQASIIVSAAMAVIIFQLYLHKKKIKPRAALPIILLAFFVSFGTGHIATIPQALSHDSGVWVPFNEDEIARNVREGKTVFVDISADWCLTCKANKRLVLSKEPVQQRLFEDPDIIPMQGDWTNPNDTLTAFLHKHGRYGIPFNAVFGPKAPSGILLPELLSKSSIFDAISHAKGNRSCPNNLPPSKDC